MSLGGHKIQSYFTRHIYRRFVLAELQLPFTVSSDVIEDRLSGNEKRTAKAASIVQQHYVLDGSKRRTSGKRNEILNSLVYFFRDRGK